MNESLHSTLRAIATPVTGILHHLNAAIPDSIKALLLIPVVYLLLRAGLKIGKEYAFGSSQIIALSACVFYVALMGLLPGRLAIYIDPVFRVYVSATFLYLLYDAYLDVREPLDSFFQRLRKRS